MGESDWTLFYGLTMLGLPIWNPPHVPGISFEVLGRLGERG